jgi:hypothetical protein
VQASAKSEAAAILIHTKQVEEVHHITFLM